MERRFDMSDFEQSLKDHADQFKMIPSRRIWNGIYNNLHPGSKWPSITVAIVFLITLVTIGSLNNSPGHSDHLANANAKSLNSTSSVNNTLGQNEPQAGEVFADQNTGRINSSKIDLKNGNSSNNTTKDKIDSKNIIPSGKISSSSLSIVKNNSGEKGKSELNTRNQLASNRVSAEGENFNVLPFANAAVNEQINEIPVFAQQQEPEANLQRGILQQSELYKNDLTIPVSYQIFASPPPESLYLTTRSRNKAKTDFKDENVLNQNTSVDAFKLHKKRNNKIEWTFYVNPTISTVSINRKTIQPSDNTSSLVVLSNQPSFKLVHNTRFGVETGAEMSLKIAKKFKFITGLNLSYSGYNNVSNLVHPTFATLTLNDKKGGTYSKNYITHYGNGQSQDHINLINYNIQASIPLGVQYNLWGNEKIHVDISSLLEPSVVLRDDAYLVSSDGRYYVNDPMLVRRTNLDGLFGSYITLIGKKIKWHLGPDFRYQLFSTYKNIYPTKEHLINYGIRIGISK